MFGDRCYVGELTDCAFAPRLIPDSWSLRLAQADEEGCVHLCASPSVSHTVFAAHPHHRFNVGNPQREIDKDFLAAICCTATGCSSAGPSRGMHICPKHQAEPWDEKSPRERGLVLEASTPAGCAGWLAATRYW